MMTHDDAIPEALKALTDHFDRLVAKMQTPEQKAAVDWLFRATPEELGAAAVRAAKRR